MMVEASEFLPALHRRASLGRFLPALLLMLCWLVRAATAVAAMPVSVSWSDGRLSVSTVDSPLDAVLAEISRRTGLMVITATPPRRRVTANFSNLPLRSALARLITQENYAIIERPGAKGRGPLVVVMILGAAPSRDVRVPGGASKPPGDHFAALFAAIQNGGPNSDKALHEAVTDPESNVRTLALQTLSERGGNAGIDNLREAARSGKPATRLAALEVLDEHPEVDSTPALTQALHDPDAEVRGYAMQLLLQKDTPQAIQALRQAANNDSDPGFREFVSEALANHEAGHGGPGR
jgi:hypothetical protein